MIKPNVLGLASTLVLLPTASWAADAVPIAGKAAYKPVQAKVRDWSGAYFGIHAGPNSNGFRSRSSPNIQALNFSGDKNTVGIGAGEIGIQAGYNVQFGNVVTGIEGESSYLAMQRATSSTNLTAKQTNRHAIKAKLGYAFGSTMLYGVAGLSINPVRVTGPANGVFPETYRSATLLGPTIGIGVEHALTDHVSIKGEIDYAYFGSKTLTFPSGTAKVDGAELTAKVGLNFRF